MTPRLDGAAGRGVVMMNSARSPRTLPGVRTGRIASFTSAFNGAPARLPPPLQPKPDEALLSARREKMAVQKREQQEARERRMVEHQEQELRRHRRREARRQRAATVPRPIPSDSTTCVHTPRAPPVSPPPTVPPSPMALSTPLPRLLTQLSKPPHPRSGPRVICQCARAADGNSLTTPQRIQSNFRRHKAQEHKAQRVTDVMQQREAQRKEIAARVLQSFTRKTAVERFANAFHRVRARSSAGLIQRRIRTHQAHRAQQLATLRSNEAFFADLRQRLQHEAAATIQRQVREGGRLAGGGRAGRVVLPERTGSGGGSAQAMRSQQSNGEARVDEGRLRPLPPSLSQAKPTSSRAGRRRTASSARAPPPSSRAEAPPFGFNSSDLQRRKDPMRGGGGGKVARRASSVVVSLRPPALRATER